MEPTGPQMHPEGPQGQGHYNHDKDVFLKIVHQQFSSSHGGHVSRRESPSDLIFSHRVSHKEYSMGIYFIIAM